MYIVYLTSGNSVNRAGITSGNRENKCATAAWWSIAWWRACCTAPACSGIKPYSWRLDRV